MAVLLLISLMAMIAAAVMVSGGGVLDTALLGNQRSIAGCAAEAGALAGLVELNKDSTWNGFTPADQTMPNGEGSYNVEVYGEGTTTPSGLVVPAGLTYILSTGTVGDAVRRQVGLMVKTGVGILDYAVLAKQQVVVDGGSRVDTLDPLTGLVLTNPANVATMEVSANSLLVSGGSTIVGDAKAGVGASPTAVTVQPGSTVSGTVGELTAPIPLDPVTLPADPSTQPPQSFSSGVSATLPPGVYGDLVVNGGATLTLDPGEYTFSSVTLNGGGQLALTGPVDMYLDNGLDVQVGSILNPSKIPSDFKIFVQDGPVDVVSGGTGYYVLYAPDSPVKLDGAGTVYGNIVGQTLQVTGGSAVHYDPSTSGSVLGGGTTLEIVTYQQF